MNKYNDLIEGVDKVDKLPGEKSKRKAQDLLFFIADKYKYLNSPGGRTVEHARNCIT